MHCLIIRFLTFILKLLVYSLFCKNSILFTLILFSCSSQVLSLYVSTPPHHFHVSEVIRSVIVSQLVFYSLLLIFSHISRKISTPLFKKKIPPHMTYSNVSSFLSASWTLGLCLLNEKMPHLSSIAHTLVQNLRVNNRVEKKTNLFSVLDDLILWSFCFLTANEADIIYSKRTYDSDFPYN